MCKRIRLSRENLKTWKSLLIRINFYFKISLIMSLTLTRQYVDYLMRLKSLERLWIQRSKTPLQHLIELVELVGLSHPVAGLPDRQLMRELIPFFPLTKWCRKIEDLKVKFKLRDRVELRRKRRCAPIVNKTYLH